jgi:hypothetical protein
VWSVTLQAAYYGGSKRVTVTLITRGAELNHIREVPIVGVSGIAAMCEIDHPVSSAADLGQRHDAGKPARQAGIQES